MGRDYTLLIIGIVVGAGLFVVGTDAGPVSLEWHDDSAVAAPAAGGGTATPASRDDTRTEASYDTESAGETEATEQSSSSIDEELLETLIHEEINEVRSENGLSELERDSDLDEVAQTHSDNMASHNFFNHTAPWGEGMEERYERQGINCRVMDRENGGFLTGAENIFRFENLENPPTEQELAQQVVEGWMNSPGHRENIMTQWWEKEGIGVTLRHEPSGYRVYVTQNFC